MRVVIVFALFACCTAVGPLSYTPSLSIRGPSYQAKFVGLDANHNNVLTKQEFANGNKKFDKNKNCILTFEEFTARLSDADKAVPNTIEAFNYFDMLDGTVDGLIRSAANDFLFTRMSKNTSIVYKDQYAASDVLIVKEIKTQADLRKAATKPPRTTSSGKSFLDVFFMMDTDKSGNLTNYETRADFRSKDTNGDFIITWGEFASGIPNAINNASELGRFYLYDKLDGDVDNLIKNVTADIIFNRLDYNRNRVVDRQEYLAIAPDIAGEIMAARELAGVALRYKPVANGATWKSVSKKDMFYILDTDKDATLSLFEFLISFRTFDTNTDDVVTLNEFLSHYSTCEQQKADTYGLFNFYESYDGIQDRLIQRTTFEYLYNRLDLNNDTSVSRAEYLASACLIEDEIKNSVKQVCADLFNEDD